MQIDFDQINDWGTELTKFLEERFARDRIQRISTDIDPIKTDPVQAFLDVFHKTELASAVMAWLDSSQILTYHATRLDEKEISSIKEHGLKPLEQSLRNERLSRILANHKNWETIRDKPA